jgi:hypothetical protein
MLINLFQIESKLILAKLFQNFDFETNKDLIDFKVDFSGLLRPVSDVSCKIYTRT